MPSMPAAIVTGLGSVKCVDIPTLAPEEGKVLVKTSLASICGSDLHVVYMGWNATGYPLNPGHPGHEAIGEVVDDGGSTFSTSNTVLTVPNVFKAACFAEYQLLEPKYLVNIPKNMPELVMAQQLGTVIYGSKQLPKLEGATVVVIGQGSVGLFHDFILRKLGASKIIAIEPIQKRLEAARQFGVDEAIDRDGVKAIEAVLDITNGEGADVVIEAVGSVRAMDQSLHLAKISGKIALFGLPPTMDMVPFDWDTFFRKRLTMYAVHGAQEELNLASFNEAVNIIVNKEINLESLMTHRLPIHKISEAFELAYCKREGVIKVSLGF